MFCPDRGRPAASQPFVPGEERLTSRASSAVPRTEPWQTYVATGSLGDVQHDGSCDTLARIRVSSQASVLCFTARCVEEYQLEDITRASMNQR
jgi:hypothetical protein